MFIFPNKVYLKNVTYDQTFANLQTFQSQNMSLKKFIVLLLLVVHIKICHICLFLFQPLQQYMDLQLSTRWYQLLTLLLAASHHVAHPWTSNREYHPHRYTLHLSTNHVHKIYIEVIEIPLSYHLRM